MLNENEIVYVDDSPIDRELATHCHESSKLRNPLLTLEHGEALLHYLADVAAGQRRMPAMILLDVNMPRMDGFEVLSRVRKDSAFAQIPTVMLTSSDSRVERERAAALGANDLRVKPFNLQDFVRLFDSLAGLV